VKSEKYEGLAGEKRVVELTNVESGHALEDIRALFREYGKPLDSRYCEMKRLYVRPAFRGRQLGVELVTRVIDEARGSGYTAMRLDTIRGAMDRAIALYRSLGFYDIPPYYPNPIPNAIYLERTL
jgi:ribosomal protein S18 acetylase RimI-like enzyme